MSFAEIPLLFVLGGLVLYVVLGGADFGAPLWQVTAGHGRLAEKIREHAHNSMAPVWEANHVWLIFVLTVMWTAYPKAFGSMASTLSVALFIAGIGIVMRGALYRSEANHVWLIFVLTVMWTAYPKAFGSMASTLSVALFIAGIGIVMRGALY